MLNDQRESISREKCWFMLPAKSDMLCVLFVYNGNVYGDAAEGMLCQTGTVVWCVNEPPRFRTPYV